MEKERRKHRRIESHNLVSYGCLDESNPQAHQGVGRTLNISEEGVLLETQEPLDPSCTVFLAFAMEDELMKIKGRVAFSRMGVTGRYETGVQFIGSGEKKIRLLRQFTTIR